MTNGYYSLELKFKNGVVSDENFENKEYAKKVIKEIIRNPKQVVGTISIDVGGNASILRCENLPYAITTNASGLLVFTMKFDVAPNVVTSEIWYINYINTNDAMTIAKITA